MEEVALIILLEEASLVPVKVAFRVSDARRRLTSAMEIRASTVAVVRICLTLTNVIAPAIIEESVARSE